MDRTAAEILGRWLEPPHPPDGAHSDEPRLRLERQWELFRRFVDQEEREGFHRSMPASGGVSHQAVTALEALALARLIADSLRSSFPWLIVEAREEGASWSDIGRALDMERQSARELLHRAAADVPDDFADVRDQYLRTAADQES